MALFVSLSSVFTTAVPFCWLEQEKIMTDKKRIDNIFFILIDL